MGKDAHSTGRGTGDERLKHVFTRLTLTTNHLRTVMALIASTGIEPMVRANVHHLSDLDDLPAVIESDVMIYNLSVTATNPAGDSIEFAYVPEYILIQAAPAREFAGPFKAMTELLRSLPNNGLIACAIEISPPGTWQPPTQSAGGWFANWRH